MTNPHSVHLSTVEVGLLSIASIFVMHLRCRFLWTTVAFSKSIALYISHTSLSFFVRYPFFPFHPHLEVPTSTEKNISGTSESWLPSILEVLNYFEKILYRASVSSARTRRSNPRRVRLGRSGSWYYLTPLAPLALNELFLQLFWYHLIVHLASVLLLPHQCILSLPLSVKKWMIRNKSYYKNIQ